MISNRPSVYIAAPLFSEQEQLWNLKLREHLVGECNVYLPQEDGALLVDLIANGMPVAEAKAVIFKRDIRAIDNCDVLVLVMDGRIIDEGACFELGYAYSRGKACIGLKTDVRSLLPVGDNPMIECALRAIFSRAEDAVPWIASRQWSAN